MAAVLAARGWGDDVCALSSNQWLYHDGGGNWAKLHFVDKSRAVLFGHDHEYSETYFGEAAEYFGEEETDLLKDAPDWWGEALNPEPQGPWIGFIYGWNGEKWQRASYDKGDGFDDVGLLAACSIRDTELIKGYISEFNSEAADAYPSTSDYEAIINLLEGLASMTDVDPGTDYKETIKKLKEQANNIPAPDHEAIRKLIAADADITHSLLGAVVPGLDIEAGVKAGRKFLEAEIE
ncbi:MAG: hypothetical protein AXA67_07045 [Methylothermaceae bacteria B42]|nr:MAG: hypothetical protein AXA67_07045 [Methylothermaceae bacteria B42]